ncbi:MAG: alpha/beta-type small acid-soluble spore protein [Thermaerobacter sp.]|nr:alpha/beta-type small acid-soluble spore protein [Thermaerobacter sp.]
MAKQGDSPSGLSNRVRDRFKYEIAQDLGILDAIEKKDWGDLPTRTLGQIGGKIGGNTVKVMIRFAEQQLAQDDTARG